VKFILEQIAQPLLVRAGSLTAGALVGAGMAAEHGPTVQQAVVVIGLLGVDLVARRFIKG
jgi:hypothetical protein